MVLRALLVAGSKSFTHMITALERYDELLMRLLADAGAAVSCSGMGHHCPLS